MDLEIQRLKKVSALAKAEIELENFLLETFNACPYPSWIKILGEHMLVNSAYVNAGLTRVTGKLMKEYQISERDKEVLELKRPVYYENIETTTLEGKTHQWTGWKIPLIYRGKVKAIAGFAEKWT